MTKISWFALGGVAVVAAVVVVWWQAGGATEPAAPPENAAAISSITPTIKTQMGLEITDTAQGTGAEAKAGDKVTVHYTGTLADGSVFDSSKTRGTPFSFTLGAGQVIRGWDEGFAGMKTGGTRKLVIPPELGYGSAQMGPIPPNSTLTFVVELLEVNGKK
ncbi:MAG: FKBP-type peptidyl-prolyl cis-trans isomerase [Candidatus Liptonbacteria bacterium]|nr:FKBP-type peptidyl-prolyl cis-trans isomerase [Candidatus Liptonbacteria bacterium]